jgi:hypothetical protein
MNEFDLNGFAGELQRFRPRVRCVFRKLVGEALAPNNDKPRVPDKDGPPAHPTDSTGLPSGDAVVPPSTPLRPREGEPGHVTDNGGGIIILPDP